VLRGRSGGLERALQPSKPILACYERLVEVEHSYVILMVVEIRVSRPSGAMVVWRRVVEGKGRQGLIARGKEDLVV
jgi:hypothetical protein